MSRVIALGLLASLGASGAGASDHIDRNNVVVFRYYPQQSLALGEEGTVHFSVNVDQQGRLLSCAVTKSSGFSRLDQATCDMLAATATFAPLQNEGGRIAGVRTGTMQWKLPSNMVPAGGVVPAGIDGLKLPDGLVCKRTTAIGSTYLFQKVCMTKREWALAIDEAQRLTTDMQAAKGPLQF